VYRPPARDAHGDPVDTDGRPIRVGGDGTNVGTVSGLVIGGPSWQPSSRRGDVVDTTGQVGVPVNEAVQPRHGDLLVVDGTSYRVHGPPQWATRGLVATPPRYRWFTITAAAN
jgi:hypothetical protein